ncbi:MAG: hypothetical protein IIB77_12580 [Proteobacteria bacterium]|nr:hypothetical protein [Pseudomonadota bacterium]
MLAARAIFAFLGCALSVTAQAHGFAERYDLPVPLHLYLAGSAAAVALSFVVVAYFVRGDRTVQRYPTFNLLGTSAGRILASRMVRFVLQLFTVFMLVLVVVAGFIGDTDPFKNIAPTTVWVIWWVGFAYISGMLGDLWALLNPWRTVFEGAQWLFAKLQSGKRLGLNRDYPEKLASWPAAILFVWFIWAELIWPASDTPAELSQMVLTYSVITWVGIFTFGSRNAKQVGLVARFPSIQTLFERKWYLDEIYDRVFVRPVVAFAKLCYGTETRGLDAGADTFAQSIARLGSETAKRHSGRLQLYVGGAVAVVAILSFYLGMQ